MFTDCKKCEKPWIRTQTSQWKSDFLTDLLYCSHRIMSPTFPHFPSLLKKKKKITMMLPKWCRRWIYICLILRLVVWASQLRTPSQLCALSSKFTSPHVSSTPSLPQFPQFPDPQLDISYLWSKPMKLSVLYTALLIPLCESLRKITYRSQKNRIGNPLDSSNDRSHAGDPHRQSHPGRVANPAATELKKTQGNLTESNRQC